MRWFRACESNGCIEIGCDTGSCIDVGCDGNEILIRDSKNPHGPVLRFSLTEWRSFVGGIATINEMVDPSC